MEYRNLQFGRDHGGGHGGVDIAYHYNAVSLFGGQHRLEPLHDLGGLLCVRSRSDGQVMVGRRQFKIAEEMGGQPVIVMLSSVDKNSRKTFIGPEKLQ